MKKSVIKVLLILGLFGFMTFPISPTIAAPEQLSSIKIGVFVPDTNNQLSVYAPWTRQGFELGMIYATNNTNQTAGGVPYEILYYDTQGNAATVATQVISAIETDGVDILVGGTWSSVAGAIAPIAKERQKLFFITPAASSALTGSLFNEYSFRVARNSWHDG